MFGSGSSSVSSEVKTFEQKEITSKEFFYNTFDLLSKNSFEYGDIDFFNSASFYPIINKITSEISVLSINKNIRKESSLMQDKTQLKVLSKYAKNLSAINYCNSQLYFEIINQSSVIDKEYSDDEAKTFFQDLLTDASRKNSSDIHISWKSDSVEIKYRMDGKLVKQPKKITKELGQALRNIFVNKSGESEYEENEVAGHIAEIVDGVKKEYRLSIGPTVHGYIIVIRMESHVSKDTTLETWGYSPRATSLIRHLFSGHHGIVLVTGATGSGKSTLLYTCIIEKVYENPVYTPEILTVEDPVEIIVDGVNQVQVNTKGDQKNWITFSSAIKMFLRQDPDMIVVGEIRDYEVAIQAVTAAKTGHLTASTLHTNDVKSTFGRLRELGIDNANIEDGIRGVISQKLLNRLCQHCKVKYERDGAIFFKRNNEGCPECEGSSVKGCKGRVPIVEIAELNNNPENYRIENFVDYYSLEENVIYLIQEGLIDEEEGSRYIHLGLHSDLAKRQYILDIWGKATKHDSKENHIFPIFQPIIDDKDYIIGFESFMRMKNDSGDLIVPKYFLDLVKEMNMYSQFSMFILDQLIEAAKKMEKKIFWNIDVDNIQSDDFLESVLNKLKNHDVLDKIVLEFSFDKKFKNFITNCNKEGIKISLDHFDGNMTDIIFIEQNGLKFDYVKTTKSFVDGIHTNEKWLDHYLDLVISNDGAIIVNFIETDAMLKEVLLKYKKIVIGYQGYGVNRPDFIENFVK